MIQETLYVAAIQLDQIWENPQANRTKIDEWFRKLDKKTDLVVLGEMFTTGFVLNIKDLAESVGGETINWLKKRSQEYGFAICGSLIIKENDVYFNRLIFVEPSGEIHFYNKRHLFNMGGEERHFQHGTKRIIVEYKGWRICPLICYDLRFPVWARNRNEYDVLIYSANWPQSRDNVWNTLLKARAVENQAFVAGVNRVGIDGNDISYIGNSQLVDLKGNVVASTEDYAENIVAAEFSYTELMNYRTNFPVLNDADEFYLIE